ncbi:type II toxin-antitoxin system HigB family toxin [Flavobacterium sp.]|uniref:type II toxin-antitoxin system HigB family toxin n=1 Tax=Flavobacterium sp. TaxID=239 RepID=UPI001210DCE4|nr:type II toxin-antitoxin system HigB family toxin [Flavobacterium sp.]RZJ69009.1 MAG: type II toxin-antitoxin system HigB family toxin [Flavobacterium sp.]
MRILVKKTILHYSNRYPSASTQIFTWFDEFSKQDFANFNELKRTYGSASVVGTERVVFNIKGNEFRLIVSINFRYKACYVIWFGTHRQYDKIDVKTIAFDANILN